MDAPILYALYGLGFATVVYIALWSIGKWLLPRWRISDGSFEAKEMLLQSQVADLERRLKDSEKKNIDLEQTQEFLLGELRKANAKMARQDEKILELSDKVQELEKVNPTLHQTGPWFRVLGVWPEGTPLLDQQGEADALYDAGYEYKALRGKEANRTGILRELDRFKPHIWEIGSHGDESGIMLSDGTARPGWWGQLAKQHRPIAAVLMACRSNQQDRLNVADALIAAGVKNVVACDQEIADVDAVKFVSLFYERLAAGASFKDAAELAKLAVSDAAREMITVR